MRTNPLWCVVAGLASVMPAAALAITTTYTSDLNPLNGSEVNGTANLVLDDTANELTVTINATGLEPNQLHPQHIHGRFDEATGEPIESFSPGPDQDADGDGFVELLEGAVTYGPVIVPLDPFPTAASDGTIGYTQIFDLTADSTFAGSFTVDDLLPLPLREIVLHGGFAPPGDGTGVGGQTSATGDLEYIAALPVASGEIFLVNSVPEPSTVWLLLIGFAATALGLRGRTQGFRA